MLILYHRKETWSWNTDFMVIAGNQSPIFLFCHPQHLASIIKSNFDPRWVNTLLISNEKRKERIKATSLSLVSCLYAAFPELL